MILDFGFKIRLVVPIKSKRKSIEGVEIIQKCEFKANTNKDEYWINLVEHDHLRLCQDELIKISSQSIFIIDEVHKALNETKRTTTALEVQNYLINLLL